jgi:hypothetical protein
MKSLGVRKFEKKKIQILFFFSLFVG